MKYSIAAILLLLITPVVCAQTMSLRSIDDRKIGAVLAYNQYEFSEWSEEEGGPNRTVHLTIHRKLNEVARLSFLPCFTYRDIGEGLINGKFAPNCHFRYTEIYKKLRIRDVGFFHREDIGLSYNPIEPAGDLTNVLTLQAQGGLGFFYDFWLTDSVFLRPFTGLFVRGDMNWQKNIMSDDTSISFGADCIGEFGIELKLWDDQSVFVTWTTSLLDLDPKLYFGTKVY